MLNKKDIYEQLIAITTKRMGIEETSKFSTKIALKILATTIYAKTNGSFLETCCLIKEYATQLRNGDCF